MPLPSPVIIGNAALYCGDCLELLPRLNDAVDAVVSDPSYGIGYQHSGGGSRVNALVSGNGADRSGQNRP